MTGSPTEVVSWDVDGTLYGMRRMVWSLVWLAIGRFLRAPVRTWRELARLRRFRRLVATVRARGGDIADAWPADRAEILALEARWYGAAIARVGPRPGVRAALEHVRAAGLRQIAVSDFQAADKLRALGLDGCFDRVYAGEALGHIKPSPRLFAAVASDLGVPPSAILHIGDRDDRDGAAAGGAGCRAWVLAPGPVPEPGRLLGSPPPQ